MNVFYERSMIALKETLKGAIELIKENVDGWYQSTPKFWRMISFVLGAISFIALCLICILGLGAFLLLGNFATINIIAAVVLAPTAIFFASAIVFSCAISVI